MLSLKIEKKNWKFNLNRDCWEIGTVCVQGTTHNEFEYFLWVCLYRINANQSVYKLICKRGALTDSDAEMFGHENREA